MQISLKFIAKGLFIVRTMPSPEPMMNHSSSRNILKPRKNVRHFTDDIYKCIFINENFCSLNKIPLKCVPYNLIDNMPQLVHMMD